MKKVLAAILSVLMLLSVSACKTGEPAVSDEPVVSQTEVIEEPEKEPEKEPGLKDILVESEWVLYSMEMLGMEIDYNSIAATGYSGSLKFNADDTFEMSLDMGGVNSGEGTYVCDDEKMIVSMDKSGEVMDVPYEDGVLTMSMSEAGVTISCEFVPTDSELIEEAKAALEAPEYDGELANTTWTFHSAETGGVIVSGSMLDQFGFSGSISFTEDTVSLELMGTVMDGSYEENGNEITTNFDGGISFALTRSSGLLSLDASDIAGEENAVFNFAYSESNN